VGRSSARPNAQAEKRTARAIREGKNLEALVAEILEAEGECCIPRSRTTHNSVATTHAPMITVLGIDLASGRWKDNGSALLRFSTTPPAWIEVLPGAVAWPKEPLTPSGIAAAIDAAAISSGALAVSLDGPQGWRDPNAISRRGVGRYCELLTRTPGKTGPYGTAYPRTMFSWITFCIEVFPALVSRPHVSLVNAPDLRALPYPAAGGYYVLECFPTSTWRTAELPMLPGKGRSTPATVTTHAAALRDRFKLPDFATPGHDDLQAIAAALPAAGLLGGPCRAVARGVPGRPCPPGVTHPAHWIEGLIWDAIPDDLGQNKHED
jgi:hypothetical protein